MMKHPSKAASQHVGFFFLAVICVSQSAEVLNQNSRISIFYYSVVVSKNSLYVSLLNFIIISIFWKV